MSGKCGTKAGYMDHRRRKQTPCSECKAAWNAYYRARRAGVKEKP